MSKWKLRVEGRAPVGPLETELIVRGIRAGRVPFDAEVCPVGSEAWVALGDVEEFYEAMELDDALTRVVDAPSTRMPMPVEAADDDGETRVMPAPPHISRDDAAEAQTFASATGPRPSQHRPSPGYSPNPPRRVVVPGGSAPQRQAAPMLPHHRSAIGRSARLGEPSAPLVDAGDDDPTVVPGAPFEIVAAAPPLAAPPQPGLVGGANAPLVRQAPGAPGSPLHDDLMDAIDDADDVRVQLPAALDTPGQPSVPSPQRQPMRFRPDEPDESTAPALRVIREQRRAQLAWIAVAALATFVLVLLALLVANLPN